MAKDDEISLRGLDSLSRTFLQPSANREATPIAVSQGQQAKPEAIQKYEEERKRDFIRRAGHFTEDLIAFIMQQRKLRELTDVESIFAIALANINLREAYGSSQSGEKLSKEEREQLLEQFDAICFGAQEYYDANT